MTTKAELTTLLTQEVKGLSSNFDDDDYSNALDDAEREIGWAFPVAAGFRTFWMKNRAKRHLYFYLVTEATEEFQVRKLYLHQKFDHLKAMIVYMDDKFEAIQESRPEEFAAVSSVNAFGTQIDAGFRYDDFGQDLTYDDESIVLFNPGEDD